MKLEEYKADPDLWLREHGNKYYAIQWHEP
jgi:hypothetical protein